MRGPASTISVITPVHPAAADHLQAAYASLTAQDLPAGWDWEWIIQEDGHSGQLDQRLAELIAVDGRIRAASGGAGGAGVARTLALGRSTGDLVRVLDADDRLAAGALGRDIAVLAGHPTVGFVTSAALDLWPDGSTHWTGYHQPEGPLARATLVEHWARHDRQLPVHPATLCIRRNLVLALGGWMALPASEDTGLLLAANAVVAGYHLGTPGLYYRKWPEQATAQPAHTDPIGRATRIDLIEQRVRALTGLFPDGLPSTPVDLH
jgi:Glycosyl transferase family 2